MCWKTGCCFQWWRTRHVHTIFVILKVQVINLKVFELVCLLSICLFLPFCKEFRPELQLNLGAKPPVPSTQCLEMAVAVIRITWIRGGILKWQQNP